MIDIHCTTCMKMSQLTHHCTQLIYSDVERRKRYFFFSKIGYVLLVKLASIEACGLQRGDELRHGTHELGICELLFIDGITNATD